jgi:hypothetical protein
MFSVAVHLVSEAGYVHAHAVDIVDENSMPLWLEAAQKACPHLGVVIMSLEESERTAQEDIARNSALMRAACRAKG